MRQSQKAEGTKIAQAAKDLNVTSVTIRRYLTEFNIETTSDENGIKVLPQTAMDELQEIRRLKEEGMTNPKVMEILEERRQGGKGSEKPEKKTRKSAAAAAAPVEAKSEEKEERKGRKAAPKVEEDDEEEVAAAKPEKRKPVRRVPKVEVEVEANEHEEESAAPVAADEATDEDQQSEDEDGGAGGDGRSKHSLTCQTCGKVFEHMNPRLRDCLDCYRAKRKERRRGAAERHKNVIQHPLAQQVANKSAQANGGQAPAAETQSGPSLREDRPSRDRDRDRDRDRGDRGERSDRGDRGGRDRDRDRGDRDRDRETSGSGEHSFAPPQQQQQSSRPVAAAAQQQSFVPPAAVQRTQVRNYRKAIEETRQMTGSLKRRLERPDLPEGERRWLEQIYAYQLILHQGWRHLAEYKAGGTPQKSEE